MAVWSYWNQILADVLINLLEQFILFPRIRFQQDIDQVIFQYPNAQCPVYHHVMFPVSFFFVQFRLGITDDVLRKVADIDRAVYILQQQDRLGPCKILYLQAVFECLLCRFNPPSHMVQFGYLLAAKGFRWQICEEHFFLVFRQRHFDHPQGNVPDPFHPPAHIRSFIMSDPAFVQMDVHPCVRCRQSGLFFFMITGFETRKE